jgi:acyl-CoA synthetase (NDP forming)
VPPQSVCFYDYGWSRHVVKSLREYLPGEQVFMSYGRMSNDEAVQFYGFLEQGNDADTYILSRLQQWLEKQLGGPLPAARLAELKAAKLLKALQEASHTYLCTLRTASWLCACAPLHVATLPSATAAAAAAAADAVVAASAQPLHCNIVER